LTYHRNKKQVLLLVNTERLTQTRRAVSSMAAALKFSANCSPQWKCSIKLSVLLAIHANSAPSKPSPNRNAKQNVDARQGTYR